MKTPRTESCSLTRDRTDPTVHHQREGAGESSGQLSEGQEGGEGAALHSLVQVEQEEEDWGGQAQQQEAQQGAGGGPGDSPPAGG